MQRSEMRMMEVEVEVEEKKEKIRKKGREDRLLD